MSNESTLQQVIDLVRQAAQRPGLEITPTTSVFADVDLDSLRTLELMQSVKATFGVDLLSPPYLIADLATPQSIAAAIDDAHATRT